MVWDWTGHRSSAGYDFSRGCATQCIRMLGRMPSDVVTDRPAQARWHRQVLPGEFALDGSDARTARDWAVDCLLFALSAALGIAILYDNDRRLWLLNVVAGAVTAIGLFWRRSHPLAFGMLAAAATCVSATAGIPWLIAIYNAALRLERRQLVPIVGIGAISLITQPLIYTENRDPIAGAVLLCLGAVALALGLGFISRARREHFFALAAAGRAAESEQRLREEQAREAERLRIAREMHDVLGHRLSLLSLHAGALEYRREVSSEEAAEAAAIIRASAQEALQELRDVIGVMRTAADVDAGPPQPDFDDIAGLIEEYRAAGVKVDVEIIGVDGAGVMAPAAGRALYRVVQEGLVNASKHAPGARVRIVIDASPGGKLRARVTNDLPVSGGPQPTQLTGTGTGLIGLQERLALVGGSAGHAVEDGRRFSLFAEVPASND